MTLCCVHTMGHRVATAQAAYAQANQQTETKGVRSIFLQTEWKGTRTHGAIANERRARENTGSASLRMQRTAPWWTVFFISATYLAKSECCF